MPDATHLSPAPLVNRGPHPIAVAWTLVFAVTMIAMQAAQGQTFTVLHSFSGGADGAEPLAGLTLDTRGDLYGTASSGGDSYCPSGVVFKLSSAGGGWTLSPIYTFTGTCQYGNGGAVPAGRVLFGPDSNLFGTTEFGGTPSCGCAGPALDCPGCGTVFSLRQPANACRSPECPWSESQILVLGENGEGVSPAGDLLFNQVGDIFGTAGLVYELGMSGGSWTQTVLSQFGGGPGGVGADGLTFDNTGNLYGTTSYGGSMGCYEGGGCGVVFELRPSNGSWVETVLYTFTGGNDGGEPAAGVIFDESGNLYGTTEGYGVDGGGTVFELSPSSGGGWRFTVLYSFSGQSGCGPRAALALHDGSLHGTTYCEGANNKGNVFKLAPSSGGWTYTSLQDFTGGTDGAYPVSNVIFDAAGNLYGTAAGGGFAQCYAGCGVVWKITP